MWHLDLLARRLPLILVCIRGVQVGVGPRLEVLLEVDDAVPGLLVVEVPVHLVQVLVLEHVEEVVPVVEDCHYSLVGRVFHREVGPSARFDEEVLLHVAVAALHKHPAVLPSALEFVFILKVWYVVHPDVFLFFVFFLMFRCTFCFLLLTECRAVVICLIIDLEFIHESFSVCFVLFSVIILISQLNPRVDLVESAHILLLEPVWTLHE